jgi:hypothetical protein
MVCGISSAPDHPDLKVVKRRGIQCRVRKTFRVSGFSPDSTFSTYNNTIDAAECAVKERVLFVPNGDGTFSQPPPPLPGRYTLGMTDVMRLFKKHAQYSTPMTAQAFAESYQGRKKIIYLEAVKSLSIKPLDLRVDANVKAFLKFEKYNFKAGKRVVPRIISPRGPRFTLSMGRYIKPIEKKIYKIVNTKLFSSPSILKGMNQEQRGKVISDKWNAFRRPCAIGIDAKRFDQHVSKDALKFCHNVYQLFYPGYRELPKLLRKQLVNKCFVNMEDGELKYKTDGSRMSGDPDTSLGNCLISACILYNLIKLLGLKVEIINDGDDCVLFMEESDEAAVRAAIPDYFLAHGFNMEVEETVYELEHVVFCQSQPVFDGNKYIMVRDPRVSLGKDCVALKPLDNEKISKMWMSSIGQCGLAITSGLPIFTSFYTGFVRGSEGAKMLRDPVMDDWFYYTSKGMNRIETRVEESARYSFWLAFGIPPDSQIAIEEVYDNITLSHSQCEDAVNYLMLPL